LHRKGGGFNAFPLFSFFQFSFKIQNHTEMTIPDIQTKLHRLPFRPFIIELENGAQILVTEDAQLFFARLRPELVIAFTGDGLQHEFEIDCVTRLLEA
jgi:hypothetical protein